MKMKKIIYLATIFGFILTGCNPLEDIYNDIDAQGQGVVGIAEYTLTDDDYAELELTFGSFNSEDDAKTLLPDFLKSAYPYFDEGSSVVVGYNLYIGSAEGVSDFTGSDVYDFINSDYATTGSDAFGFYPDVNATSAISAILDTQVASPTEDQLILANYDQYTETPEVGLASIVEYNFEGSMEGWTVGEEFGADEVWTSQSGYVQGNSYFGGQVANTEWLVSPSIDLTGQSDLKFQITHAVKYANDASLLKIMVSTDYTDDVLTATWDEITLATAPGVDNLDPSEDYDFSAYDGETINIAFRYESSDSDAGRWRIESLAIKTLGATGNTNSKGEYFMYSGGNWEAVDGVYYLSSGDYDSMGTASGQPGKYNNFSSSIPADSYITKFLSMDYPYAQEDDEIIVIYKYFSSSAGATQTRGNLYTFINGEWIAHESTIATTLQFGVEDGVFVPDNTIRYTLTSLDYEYMGNTLSSDPIYAGIVPTLLNYHDYDSSWSKDQIVYSLGVLLDYLDSDAAEGQKYLLSYLVYSGGLAELSVTVIKEEGVWIEKK